MVEWLGWLKGGLSVGLLKIRILINRWCWWGGSFCVFSVLCVVIVFGTLIGFLIGTIPLHLWKLVLYFFINSIQFLPIHNLIEDELKSILIHIVFRITILFIPQTHIRRRRKQRIEWNSKINPICTQKHYQAFLE